MSAWVFMYVKIIITKEVFEFRWECRSTTENS